MEARRYPEEVRFRRVLRLILSAALLLTSLPRKAEGFSVLAHQAVVDRTWESTLAPAITARHPGADLARARAFAYGGSHVADLGYFPLGSVLFTELLHYVRTGELVRNLIASARDANELAFALGALAHWVADTTGHPEATNRVVPMIYPKLRKEFGDEVTYADDHASHLQTEFRFDAFQMAQAQGGRDVFHHALQFEVATRALGEAFQRTYGLRLDDLFASTDAAILAYRWAFRGLVQEVTGIAWELYRADIEKLDPSMTPAEFVYELSDADFEKEFGEVATKPGAFARFFGFLVKMVPDVGPLRRTVLKPLPPDARERYETALAHAVARYREAVAQATAQRLDLPERNLDTAKPVRFGDYEPADEAYAGWAEKLAKREDAPVSPDVRADIARFYANRQVQALDDDDRDRDAALARLAVAGQGPASAP